MVRPKGKHQATIVWLHGLGDKGSRYCYCYCYFGILKGNGGLQLLTLGLVGLTLAS